MRPRSAAVTTVLLVTATVLAGCSESPDTSPTSTSAGATSSSTSPPTTAGAIGATSTTGTSQAPITTAGPTTAPVPPSPGDLTLVPVVEGGLTQPVLALAPPAGGPLHIVDQEGRIVTEAGDVVLDIIDRVQFQGEQGLLGLAFRDDYADSGRLVVNYIDQSGNTRVSEFTAGDPESERSILEIEQPAANHNGGMIAFGPDGYLWVGMGDGGGAGDEFGNGQDAESLLGGMLRIDLDGDPYATPPDNPQLDGWAAEKWAIGLRNPWRWAFDGDDLWIADVGQGAWEEIDLVDAGDGSGLNFGWPVLEGSHCFAEDPCDATGLVAPVVEYSHDEGCSITGGFVYRGTAIPGLDGHYFYGDYCGGWIRSVVRDGDGFTETEWFPPGTVDGLTGFGVDADGELYVLGTEGPVYRIEAG